MLRKVEKKLTTTKHKVSKDWQKYRTEKKHILSLKRLAPDQKKMRIESALDLTRQKISTDWKVYKEEKYSLVHKSPYHGFNLIKKLSGVHKDVDGEKQYFKFHDSYQKIFKAKKNFNTDDLDNVVPKILEEKNVRGVLVVFEVTFKSTGETRLISNFITRGLMENIEEQEETVYEFVSNLFSLGYKEEVSLKFIYLRVIYNR